MINNSKTNWSLNMEKLIQNMTEFSHLIISKQNDNKQQAKLLKDLKDFNEETTLYDNNIDHEDFENNAGFIKVEISDDKRSANSNNAKTYSLRGVIFVMKKLILLIYSVQVAKVTIHILKKHVA